VPIYISVDTDRARDRSGYMCVCVCVHGSSSRIRAGYESIRPNQTPPACGTFIRYAGRPVEPGGPGDGKIRPTMYEVCMKNDPIHGGGGGRKGKLGLFPD
jgi:hypothetical protein